MYIGSGETSCIKAKWPVAWAAWQVFDGPVHSLEQYFASRPPTHIPKMPPMFPGVLICAPHSTQPGRSKSCHECMRWGAASIIGLPGAAL